MNELLASLSLQAWKPVLTALLLPPVPLLLLVLVGAWRLAHKARGGWAMILVAVACLWLGSTQGAASLLAQATGLAPPALDATRRLALAREQAAEPGHVAIVVLGGGRELLAPEYGAANLSGESLERLRYGLWLARTTGIPVGFAGGTGWTQDQGEAEADIAARIALQEHGQALRWIENQSRDTRENAALMVPMLKAAGVKHVLLVTHGWHTRRAVRAFVRAAGTGLVMEAAPMGLASPGSSGLVNWLPSVVGLSQCRLLLRELVGLTMGA